MLQTADPPVANTKKPDPDWATPKDGDPAPASPLPKPPAEAAVNKDRRRRFRARRTLLHAAAGFGFGLFVVHPLSMAVLAWLGAHSDAGLLPLGADLVWSSFTVGIFPMGVVFGLFGYVWMKTIFDPGSGIFISQITIVIMVVYFFVCLSGVGIFSNIANTAHAVGLVVGLAIGYAPVMWDSLRGR